MGKKFKPNFHLLLIFCNVLPLREVISCPSSCHRHKVRLKEGRGCVNKSSIFPNECSILENISTATVAKNQ